eukprot:3591783-Amphidinium_carterae.1
MTTALKLCLDLHHGDTSAPMRKRPITDLRNCGSFGQRERSAKNRLPLLSLYLLRYSWRSSWKRRVLRQPQAGLQQSP